MKRVLLPAAVAILVCLAIAPAASEKPAPFVLTPSVLLLDVGASAVITASGPVKSWASSDVSVAVFSGAGLVSAVGAGEAVITAKNGPYVAQTYVTVVDPNPPPPPPQPPVIEPLVVSCPANQAVVSEDGAPVPVVFSATAAGGVAPVSITAAPASGSPFSVGSTAVQVSAASTDGQVSACAFNVTVSVPAPAPAPPPSVPCGQPGGTAACGPQPTITCPVGAVYLTNGATSVQLQSLINANVGPTTFCISAGTHAWTERVVPKSGNVFIGEYGAIIDGTWWTSTDIWTSAIGSHVPAVGIAGVTIKNIRFTNLPQRAVLADGLNSDWTIESNEVDHTAGGLFITTNGVLRKNYIHNNTSGYFGYKTSNGLIEDNEIAYNGEQKVLQTTRLVFRNNYVHHNSVSGIWYDYRNTEAVIEDNTVEDNGMIGIFYEWNGPATIRHNISRRNARHGLMVTNSTGVAIIGNTFEDNLQNGINLWRDGRVGSDPNNLNDLQNTTISLNTIRVPANPGAGGVSLACAGDVQATTVALYAAGSKWIAINQNAYHVSNPASRYWYWPTAGRTWADWLGLGNDTTGTLVQR
jgi:hypothetical protein